MEWDHRPGEEACGALTNGRQLAEDGCHGGADVLRAVAAQLNDVREDVGRDEHLTIRRLHALAHKGDLRGMGGKN